MTTANASVPCWICCCANPLSRIVGPTATVHGGNRLLQFLVEERRRTVNERTRQSNRLTTCLKQYFPQILLWFDGVDSPLVGALLERWPSLETLRRAHPGTLRQFFQKHNCRSAERNQERIDAIYAAVSEQ